MRAPNPIIVDSVREELLRLDPKGSHQTACSGGKALKLSEQLSLDVVFLDIEMPGWNGLEIAKQLKTICPQTNIIFITGHSEYALQAFELYVSGFHTDYPDGKPVYCMDFLYEKEFSIQEFLMRSKEENGE